MATSFIRPAHSPSIPPAKAATKSSKSATPAPGADGSVSRLNRPARFGTCPSPLITWSSSWSLKARLRFSRNALSKLACPTAARSSIASDNRAATRFGVAVVTVKSAAVAGASAPFAFASAVVEVLIVALAYVPDITRGISIPSRGAMDGAKIAGRIVSRLTPTVPGVPVTARSSRCSGCAVSHNSKGIPSPIPAASMSSASAPCTARPLIAAAK